MWLPGLDLQAGRGQAAVDQVGPVLDFLQLALDDADQAVQVGGGEVSHGPLEQRPDALSRFAAVHGSLDRRLLARRLSAGRACCGWVGGPGRYEDANLRGAGGPGAVGGERGRAARVRAAGRRAHEGPCRAGAGPGDVAAGPRGPGLASADRGCARWPGRCWPTRTGSTIRIGITTAFCSG